MAVDRGPEVDANPSELIITIYGLYARTDDSWLSVASIVRLMADLGADEHAVRAAVYRLKQRGVLIRRKIASVAGYELSPTALQSFAEGDARIFGRRRAVLSDEWLILIFSVPETERDRRHELRTELQRLDFGMASPGVWVAPGNLRDETELILRRRGLSKYVDIFQGTYFAFEELKAKVQSWWDFSELDARHRSFIAEYRPAAARWAKRALGDREAFGAYIRMVTIWRRIPDPRLPIEVLPKYWAGLRSEVVFDELSVRLRGPAERHARSVIERWGVNGLPRRATAV